MKHNCVLCEKLAEMCPTTHWNVCRECAVHLFMEWEIRMDTETNTLTNPRPLSAIARDIRRCWMPKVGYAAEPYVAAMAQLDTMKDKYIYDDAVTIVLYFLTNAVTWRGPDAKRIKNELKAMLKAAGH